MLSFNLAQEEQATSSHPSKTLNTARATLIGEPQPVHTFIRLLSPCSAILHFDVELVSVCTSGGGLWTRLITLAKASLSK